MDESRLITLKTVTASGKVSERPCLIYCICGIGIAQTSNVYGIHDGQTSGDKRRFRLVAGSYSADFRLYASPLYFTKGIYIDFTTNGEEVTVQYLELGG